MSSRRRTAAAPTTSATLPTRLTPLMVALAACWPLWTAAGTTPPPAGNAVPVPSASWRVYGNGGAAPVNRPNPQGGISQSISQTSQRAIYQWQSFDVGANSDVTFDMAAKGYSALNRVMGGGPTKIFGQLKATNGGEIYLINANGVLFGCGAQVNTGSLIASALNISDGEFLSGLTNSLLYHKDQATFAYSGAAADFVDSKNFVRVEEGASITTDAGGRVFLFAKRVDNAGSISAPSGQVMLAAGGKVWLQSPADAPLYASEANEAVPTLRGLLVEVGAGPAGGTDGVHGTATNATTGTINSARGNATIVAMAVNQMGRVSATSTVNENGSIILRAQGGASYDGTNVKAQHAGDLVLGAGSQTTISPDAGQNKDTDPVLTSDGNATFVNPRIDLAGASVLLDRGAQVVAPGATVDVRALATPDYTPFDQKNFAADGNGPPSRIVLAENAVIDVSGTTTAVDSVERFFVTTGLLGSNDLKDAPLQKDGLLYRSRATVDVRDDSAILGSLDGYRNSIQQTIEERLAVGGKVNLVAGDGVVTHASSRIDVSGGQVAYTGAQVRETQLIGQNGQVFDLNTAPADQVFTSALNLQKGSAAGFDRWGVKVNYGSVTPTHFEAGYTEGRAAGTVNIVAPQVVLQGHLDAKTRTGTRQQRGEDAAADRGALTVGAVHQSGRSLFGNPGQDAVLGQFNISTQGPQLDASFWDDDPTTGPAAAASGIQSERLTDAGFGKVEIAAVGDVSVLGQSATAPLDLGDQTSLRVVSTQGDVRVGGAIRSAGGQVELESQQHAVKLTDGASVNLSGKWFNTVIDGPRDTSAAAGGSFSATGQQAVVLGAGSTVDVSGGAVVSGVASAAVVAGGPGGSIALSARSAQSDAVDAPSGLVMNGELRGQSLGTGGSLSLSAPRVLIADAPVPEAGVLGLSSALFSQGGFSSFAVDGSLSLDVAGETHLAPERSEWHVDPRAAALAPTGSATFAVAEAGRDPLAASAAPIKLSLSSSSVAGGILTVAEGAQISAPALSTISLKSTHRLLMDGEIKTAGGQVNLALSAKRESLVGTPATSTLWLGEHSHIDVSGTVLRTPSTDGVKRGQVLAGGTIALSAQGMASSKPVMVVQQGAQLDARGTSAVLDRSVLGDSGVQWQREVVGSDGGRVSIDAGRVLVMEGQVALQGGGHGASGGTLSVNLSADTLNGSTNAPGNQTHELRVGAGATDKTGGVALGDLAGIDGLLQTASIGAQTIQDSGAANVTLGTRERVRLLAGSDLAIDGTLTINSTALAVQPDQQVKLQAGQIVLQSHNPVDDAPVMEAEAGTGSLDLSARGGLSVRGQWVTAGIDQLHLDAGGDMMLAGTDATHFTGGIRTLGDVTLSARQIYPTTRAEFTISAAGRDVTIAGHDIPANTVEKPLSAGGHLSVQAATITQSGIVRAPQGQITLQASDTLALTDGSETSVSAQGLVLPYGSFVGGKWLAPGNTPIDQAPVKQVSLEAPTVAVSGQAVVDLKGGGDLVGYEFVAGRGGSTDVFAGGNGAYALLPGVHTAAVYDPTLNGAAAQGRLIEIGAGGPVPAGTYTLLPARYALQPGAFLIEPVKTSTTLALGSAVRQTDGSVWVGARLRTEGSGIVDSQTSTWRVSARPVARERSEVRETSANAHWAELAARAGSVAFERPVDAGTLTVAAQQAQLDGDVAMAGGAGGRGGRAEFVAAQIEVGDGTASVESGALHLSTNTLNALGAQTVVLGARSGGATETGTTLDVGASSVHIDTQGQTLTVADLVVAATESVTVDEGSRIHASAHTGAAPATPYLLEGDGAALRVSGQRGATVQRSAVVGAQGTLNVAARSQLDAAGGSLVLDAAADTQIANSTQLHASEVTLGAHIIALGSPGAGPGVLAMTPRLMQQVSQSDQLTLRGYTQINVLDGTRLGQDDAGQPMLAGLVLDTPVLRAVDATEQGAQITAGAITLTNTSGLGPQVANPGEGHLTLSASRAAGGSGRITLADGAMVVNGAASLALQADEGIALAGADSQLTTAGDLRLSSQAVVAAEAGASAKLKAGGLLQIEAVPEGVAPPSALGGAFVADARQIVVDGRIVLPAGQVALQAAEGLTLGADSRIDVSGHPVAVGEAQVDVAGGRVALGTTQGDLSMAGGVVNVSGAGTAAGGRLSLAAPRGQVDIQGQLRGSGDGAGLSVDSGQALDVAALMRHVDTTEGLAFGGALHLRQRQGDLTVGPLTVLAAREIELTADGGALTLQGELDADRRDGGRIRLAARDDVTLAAGAQLNARAQVADGIGGDGGQVQIESRDGRIRLMADSRIDLSAAESGNSDKAGRLTLRASRLGMGDALPGGNEVDIAPIASTLVGVGRVDVEAVKVYDGIGQVQVYGVNTPGTLLTSTIAEDGLAFVGQTGQRAEAIAGRLAQGNEPLGDLIRVHAGAEVRSSGYLSTDAYSMWQLPDEAARVAENSGNAQHVGNTSITLRAAGDLNVRHSIESGFNLFGQASSAAGGSIRLVAGADLAAASSTATQAGGATGSLDVGRESRLNADNTMTVRTTTGEIVLAAAGDVQLNRGRTSLYTAGAPTDDAQAQALAMRVLPASAVAFNQAAGDVRVMAGGNVIGRSTTADFERVNYAGHVNQWTRIGDVGGQVYWAADVNSGETFQRGLASFGGGQVSVLAGGDVVDLIAAAPSTGYIDRDGVVHHYGGGSVRVEAGRDVVGGVLQAGGSALTVDAGRDVAYRELPALGLETDGLWLNYEDTAVSVQARRHATVGAAQSSHSVLQRWVSGLDANASLAITASAGDLVYRGDAESANVFVQALVNDTSGQSYELMPTRVAMAAPSGSIELGSTSGLVQQAQRSDARFEILAARDLSVNAPLQINATWTAAPAFHDGSAPADEAGVGLPGTAYRDLAAGSLSRGDGDSLDHSDRQAVRLVAAQGDLYVGNALRSARPVRVMAGRDLMFTDQLDPLTDIQHQPERLDGTAPVAVSELSLFQAGRDIMLNREGIAVAGPGDLVLLAGRDVDLGRGRGVQATGNIDNAARLNTGSAQITLVAGLRADGADYAEAARRGFAALGAAGLTGRAADLYALLSAPDGSTPTLGSAEAQAFAALGTDAQLDQVRTLLGQPAYDAAVVRYVRGLVGHGGDSESQALQAFAGLSEVKRAAAPGTFLAGAFGDESAASRHAFITQVAAADAPKGAQGLVDFMQVQTGQKLALADALVAFEALPLERQLLRLNQVLVDEVKANGRAAVDARLATDKEAAYDRGYAAINALFPVDDASGAPRLEGDIRLPTTLARTLQGSGITLLAPGGEVNAGESGSTGKLASQLGIVTVAGGDINGIARDDILVNQSRIFTLAEGNILLWSSTGDVDAGRGAKTVTGSPAPVYRLDSSGRIVVDTSGSFSGSGIAVLDADSTLDLYAPAGAIDAGEAGIRALGSVTLGADVVRGTDDIVGGSIAGAPPATPTVGVTAGLAAAADAASTAGRTNTDDEEERRRKRRARRQLLLEFLGFGQS